MNKFYSLLFAATVLFSFSPTLPESHASTPNTTGRLLWTATLQAGNIDLPNTAIVGEHLFPNAFAFHTASSVANKNTSLFAIPVVSPKAQQTNEVASEFFSAAPKVEKLNKDATPGTNQLVKVLL
jgi:hypothetical protein